MAVANGRERDELTGELCTRGVFASLAAQLVASSDEGLVALWLDWFDRQQGIGPGGLVDGIRSGQPPAEPSRQASLAERQTAYGNSVVDWLSQKLPDVFAVNAKVVEATRQVYGDVEANALAASTGPHPAAVAAVIRLHHTEGKLTVKEHGPAIRAAVRAFDALALSDLKAIAASRQQSIERSQTA